MLRTDADAERADELVQGFEALHAALRGVVGQTERIEGEPIEVVVFEQEREFRARAEPNETFGGFFTQHLLGDVEPRPMIVFYLGRWNKTGRQTFLHETVHRFVRATAPNAPPWIGEGLAKYYESLRVEEGVATLGEPPGSVRFWPQADLAFRLRTPIDEVPTVAELLAADPETFYGKDEAEPTTARANKTFAFYDGAWVLVHMLMHGPPEYGAALGRTMAALQEGKSAKAANDEGLGRLRPDEIERAFRAYLERSKAALRGVRVKDVATGTAGAPRAMPDVDVHLLWSRLRAARGTLDASLAEVDEALRESAGAPEAQHQRGLVLVRQKHVVEALPWLHAAATARPEEPRYLLGEINGLGAIDEAKRPPDFAARMEGLHARLAKVASSARQLEAVARYHRHLDRPDQALAVLERAVKKDPTCWSCWDVRSLAHLDRGEIEEARVASDRALAYLPEGMQASRVKEHRRLIEAAAARPTSAHAGSRFQVQGPGRLSAEAIAGVVRGRLDTFDACLEAAPAKEPKLEGRVAVRFVIGADGAAKDARDQGSDLPDAAVVACVVEAFGALKFAAPEGGSLEVIYPIVFSARK